MRSKRAKSFIATRRQHNLEAAEDYTELVADLIAEKGEARLCDIARHMGISHVTALRTLRRLQGEGYVSAEPRKPIVLTTSGKRLASNSKKRHRIIYSLLLSLGVQEEVATIDAEGMEHHVSKETLHAFERFLEREG